MSDDRLIDRLRRRHQGYSGARPDVLALVPAAPQRVLDVGCGAGITAELLRSRYNDVHVSGIEPDPVLAALARERMDDIIEEPVDNPATAARLATCEPFDLILCADVLEHLEDPWATLRNLVGRLAPDGHLITSIPNVRHVSTFVALGLFGTWPRRARGIHDATHLRFFTRRDVLALGRQAGLEDVRERRNLRLIESKAWTSIPARLLDFWPFRGFVTFQYLHLWRRSL